MDSPVTPSLHKQGYLVKKGHIRHSWRTRWFVLSKNSLEYFKTRQDTKSKGKIPLLGASLNCPVYSATSGRPWMLIITTVDGKEYHIQAPDKESRDEWKYALEENIRRLDPSKRSLSKRGVTMSRSLTGDNPSDSPPTDQAELVKLKDIIEAMQDSSAGVKLHELRRGRFGRHVDKYFTGSAAVDWLLAWYFATTRPEAITLCNSMLRNGLFHAIIEEDGKNGMVTSIAKDRQACHQFEDSESARYIFLSFVSAPSVEKLLFNDIDELEEDDHTERGGRSNGISKDTSSPTSPTHSQSSSPSNIHILNHHHSYEDFRSIPTQDSIRQGYLLKQGHLRKNWKIRKFVLKDTCLEYYRVEKVKSKPQGVIQLSGSTVSIYDERDHQCSPPVSPGRPKRHSLPPRLRTSSSSPVVTRPHMFCIETDNNIRYIIQAESDDERLQWMTDIQKQIDYASSAHKRPIAISLDATTT